MRKGEVNYKRLKSFLDILESIPNDEKRDEALELLLLDSSNLTHSVPQEKQSRQKYNVEMESIDIEFKTISHSIISKPIFIRNVNDTKHEEKLLLESYHKLKNDLLAQGLIPNK